MILKLSGGHLNGIDGTTELVSARSLFALENVWPKIFVTQPIRLATIKFGRRSVASVLNGC